MPPCELDHLVLSESKGSATHHPLPNVRRVTWLRLSDIEEQLSFDLPPLRVAPASAPKIPSGPSPLPAGTNPKPPASKNKKKKKKKQIKLTPSGDNEMPGLESVLESRSAPQPTTGAKPAVAKNSVMREDSDDSEEPPPLSHASNKRSMPRKAQPKGVADESEDSDSMPPLIPASQAAGASSKPQETLPKKSKAPRSEPEISPPDADRFGPGGARLFEALGTNPHMLDSMLKTFPGLSDVVGGAQPVVGESDSSNDDSPPSLNKSQCELPHSLSSQ